MEKVGGALKKPFFMVTILIMRHLHTAGAFSILQAILVL